MINLITINYVTTKYQLYTANILGYDNNDALSCLKRLVNVKSVNWIKPSIPVHAISENVENTITKNNKYVKDIEIQIDPDAYLLQQVEKFMAKGFTQKQVAEKIGLSRSKVCRLLKKK